MADAFRKTKSAKVIPLFPGMQMSGDSYEMTVNQLLEYRKQLEAQIRSLDEQEPADEASEVYEAWADRHEDLEDQLDEILDLLDEMDL